MTAINGDPHFRLPPSQTKAAAAEFIKQLGDLTTAREKSKRQRARIAELERAHATAQGGQE